MNNAKKTVALIYGGQGKEHDVSVEGAKYLLGLIDTDKYIPYPILIDGSGVWKKDGVKEVFPKPCGIISEGGRDIKIDVAFPLLHGDFGEDGSIQGLLSILGFRFVGTELHAGAIGSDKHFTKLVANSIGIRTVKAILPDAGESAEQVLKRAEGEIGFPMFIKPRRLGSSVGAGVAYTEKEFRELYSLAYSLGEGKVLIEEYIENKRELECAYLGTREGEIFTHPGEVICRGVYGYKEKYSKATEVRLSVRADIDAELSRQIIESSKKIAHALGVRQISRLDFFLSDGVLYFNEINTMPGFTEGSLYPKMLDAHGISPRELIDRLIEDALVL